MKLVKTILVLSILQSCQALAVGITADPELTSAAGLSQMLVAKAQNANTNDGFDNTPEPILAQPLSRMFGAQLFNGATADSGSSIGFNPSYIIGPGEIPFKFGYGGRLILTARLPSTLKGIFSYQTSAR